MRISDWSSDVCASDLLGVEVAGLRCHGEAQLGQAALRRPGLLVLDEADKLAERGPGGIQHLGQRLGAWPALLAFLGDALALVEGGRIQPGLPGKPRRREIVPGGEAVYGSPDAFDRKSTRLNSSH